MPPRTYIAIDLKSFYASVECADRQLPPLTTHLVVADESRTEKTICLAVSPSLKAQGLPGRARLFEVVQKVNLINSIRQRHAPYGRFSGSSVNDLELKACPELQLSYIIAKPRMARYLEVSSQIFAIYLKYVSPEDIHVYSIDEVFIDATRYLQLYSLSPRAFTMKLIRDVLSATNITATAGIGTNLYLAKIAMDIVAKHIPADNDGVRIAELNEMSYRRQLWTHEPLTDFWRIGHGYADKLMAHGMRTMGDVARVSLNNEELLYRLFGINAELLIDHAWGWEPCLISDIKSYKPETNSISSGQVLQHPYDYHKTRLVVREMTDLLVLDLVEKKRVTDQMVLTICYDIANLSNAEQKDLYHGPVKTDCYGRTIPKEAHGSIHLEQPTSSTQRILTAVMELFDRIANPQLLARKIYVIANHVIPEHDMKPKPVQLDLFTDYKEKAKQEAAEHEQIAREKRRQEAIIAIRKSLGKNAILKGMNLEEGATAKHRNNQIGGHQA